MLQECCENLLPTVIQFLVAADLIHLSQSSSAVNRITVNASLLRFSSIFEVDLANPHTIFPRSKGDLFRLISRAEDESKLFYPLIFACASGYVSFVDLSLGKLIPLRRIQLIEGFVDEGYTPLIVACKNNHISIVRSLLRFGSNVNVEDNFGRNALWYACEGGYHEIVRELIECGSSCKNICSALVKAVESASSLSCELTASRVLAEIEEVSVRLFENRLDEPLLRKGRDLCDNFIKAVSSCIVTPFGASRLDSLQVILRLLRKFEFAARLIKDFSKESPLIFAALGNRADAIEPLLESKLCEVSDQIPKSRKTALHVAAEAGNIQCVEILLRNGASVSSKTSSGRNCMHVAVERDHVQILEMMCEYATARDIQQVHGGGVSPFHLAENRGRLKMVIAMLRCYKRTATPSTVNAHLTAQCLKLLVAGKGKMRKHTVGKKNL
jgi:ankyrin repeat protein